LPHRKKRLSALHPFSLEKIADRDQDGIGVPAELQRRARTHDRSFSVPPREPQEAMLGDVFDPRVR
jgi:hypothetical protein